MFVPSEIHHKPRVHDFVLFHQYINNENFIILTSGKFPVEMSKNYLLKFIQTFIDQFHDAWCFLEQRNHRPLPSDDDDSVW